MGIRMSKLRYFKINHVVSPWRTESKGRKRRKWISKRISMQIVLRRCGILRPRHKALINFPTARRYACNFRSRAYVDEPGSRSVYIARRPLGENQGQRSTLLRYERSATAFALYVWIYFHWRARISTLAVFCPSWTAGRISRRATLSSVDSDRGQMLYLEKEKPVLWSRPAPRSFSGIERVLGRFRTTLLKVKRTTVLVW